MTLEIAFFLSLIQGLTEFLPISSSAHLILPSHLFGWKDQGLAFDVAVHVGTLLAVCFYFRLELLNMLQSWILSIIHREIKEDDAKLAWFIILATMPALIFGFLFNDFIETYLRSILVIGLTTIIFGLLLWYSDVKGLQVKNNSQMTWVSAIFIGFAQSIALIPGTSRSGITITASLLLGFDRQSAAKFSFLLSVPLIGAAGIYKCVELIKIGGIVDWSNILIGIVLSAISAYLCIHFFLTLINRIKMFPFVLYRLVLGTILLTIWIM